MTNKSKVSYLAAAILMGCLALPATAQTPAPAGGGAPAAGNDNNGRNNNRGRYDPAEYRQRMMDDVKSQLGMSDEEFKAIQPQVEKVMQLQRDTLTSRFAGGNRGNRGNRNGNNAAGGNPPAGAPAAAGGAANPPAAGGEQPQVSAVAQKVRELQDMLENKDAKPEEIKSKLDALREARAKAKDELTKAQADLRELLTQRQEAVLVTRGWLD